MKAALTWAVRIFIPVTYLDLLHLAFLGPSVAAATGFLAGLLHHFLP